MKTGCIGSRHVLVFWAFFGFLIMYILRVNLSVALVAMVNSTISDNKDEVQSDCDTGDETNQTSDSGNGQYTFNWSQYEQGIILGAFFWGYMVTQIPGGMLAHRYSAKWVFGLGGLVTSLLTLITPWAAHMGPGVLIAVRILEGLGEAVTYPAIQTLLGRWSPPLERSKLVACVMSGTQMGTIIGLPLTGYLCNYGFAGGWPSAFYISGVLGCIWFVIWTLCVFDDPLTHPRISVEEKEYIVSSIGINSKVRRSVPWSKVLLSAPYWSLMITHFCHNWAWYGMVTWLPTYMSAMLKFKIESNGLLSALPYASDWVVIVTTSSLADLLRSKEILSTTTTRKLFNTVGLFGVGMGLLGVGYVGCDYVMAVVLFCVSLGLQGLCQSGFGVNFLDIAPQYAGSLGALSNSIGTIPGVMGPYVVGVITQGGETRAHWQTIFYISASISWFGALVFMILGSGERQPWAVEEDDAAALLDQQRQFAVNSVISIDTASTSLNHEHLQK